MLRSTVWPCLCGPLGGSCGQELFSVVYACTFTSARSFTLLSVRGVFIDGVFLVFPLPPLPTVLVFPLNSCSVCGCLDGGSILAGGARGWVASRADLWGVLPTRVWVGGTSPHVPEHPTCICDAGVNVRNPILFREFE